jgi:uncharacterized membrane protein
MEEINNTTPQTPENGKKNNTLMAVIAYIVFFVPLLTDDKNDPFVKFHVKQGAVIFIVGLVAWVLMMALPFLIPLVWLVQLFLLGMVILGILNVVNNKKEKLPLIGDFADKLNF